MALTEYQITRLSLLVDAYLDQQKKLGTLIRAGKEKTREFRKLWLEHEETIKEIQRLSGRENMPRGKLPPGFGLTLKRLIAQGMKAPEAMKEAWRLHGKAPGNPRQKFEIGEKGRYIRERLRSPKGLYHMRTVTAGKHKVIIGCPVKHKGGRCPVGTVAQAILHPLREKRKLGIRNPIAVYNPRRAVVLPATNIAMTYRRTGGEYKGENFEHRFGSHARCLLLPDGSVLLKSRKKLWGYS